MTAKSPQKCSYSYLNSQYIAFLQLKRYVYKLKLESNFPVQEQIDKTNSDFDHMGPFNAVLRITDNRFWAKKSFRRHDKIPAVAFCCLFWRSLFVLLPCRGREVNISLDSVVVESNPQNQWNVRQYFLLLKRLTFKKKVFEFAWTYLKVVGHSISPPYTSLSKLTNYIACVTFFFYIARVQRL